MIWQKEEKGGDAAGVSFGAPIILLFDHDFLL
jgi:hypothetical protein